MSKVRIDVDPNWYADYCRDLWQGMKPMTVYWRNLTIHIPAYDDCVNFVCDMYSIPTWARWRWPRNMGEGNAAAYTHDFTRRFRNVIPGMTMAISDMIFLDMMMYYDIREARLFYGTVRLQSLWDKSSGDGLPPTDVRRAMVRNGDWWGEYIKRVELVNKGV